MQQEEKKHISRFSLKEEFYSNCEKSHFSAKLKPILQILLNLAQDESVRLLWIFIASPFPSGSIAYIFQGKNRNQFLVNFHL